MISMNKEPVSEIIIDNFLSLKIYICFKLVQYTVDENIIDIIKIREKKILPFKIFAFVQYC